MYTFLLHKNYVNEEGVTREGMLQMREYCFYLILNSDLPIIEDLLDMPGIANIVWTIPTVNKCLICEMIWGLNMEDYLKEILVYCHPALSLQAFIQFTEYVAYTTPTKCFNHLKILVTSCYQLICRIHYYNYDDGFISTILSDLYDNFLVILNYYTTPPNADKLNRLTEDELHKHRGDNIYNLLSSTYECLGYFLSRQTFEPEDFDEMYLSTIKPHHIKTRVIPYKMCESENNMLLDYLHKFNTALLEKCKVLVMETSVEIYCAWSEFEENGKTMQQNIGELCYLLRGRMEKIHSLLEHPLFNMLIQLSCKPADIHDIIKCSDNDSLIENAYIKSEEQKYWLQAIINKTDLYENGPLLECLLNNIESVDEEDCSRLYSKSQEHFSEQVTPHSNMIKLLMVKVFLKLSDTKKIEILNEHFCNRFLKNNLQTQEFHNMITELFNKITTCSATNISDVYGVFIQNPHEVYKKILQCAIDNSQQSELMMKIMTMLGPFANHYYHSDVDPAIIKCIEFITHNLKTDNQLNNFIHFISEMKKSNILSGAKILLLIIMPGLHTSLLNKDIRMINVHVRLLRSAFDLSELLQYRAPLLKMISQTLEIVRWNFATFSSDAPATLEETLKLQMSIFSTYEPEIPGNLYFYIPRLKISSFSITVGI